MSFAKLETLMPQGSLKGHNNGLQSKVIFDNLGNQTKKRPEIPVSGILKTTGDSAKKPQLNGHCDEPIIAGTPNFRKDIGAPMSQRFIKVSDSEDTFWLMKHHPIAYLLLNLISLRANRTSCVNQDGLMPTEAYIGDHESIGATRQQYRTALKILTQRNFIKIIETCRTRKKSTTGSTTKGTKVSLLDSTIFDINPEKTNHRINHCPTTDQPPTNHEQEELYNSISHTMFTMSSSQAQTTKVKERIFFDWEKGILQGIEKSDIDSWTQTFPHVDVVEYLKFIQEDIKSKPTKYGNRKRIVQTVVIYLKNKNENEARYQQRKKNGEFAKPQEQKPSKHNNPDFAPKEQKPLAFNNKLSFKE